MKKTVVFNRRAGAPVDWEPAVAGKKTLTSQWADRGCSYRVKRG